MSSACPPNTASQILVDDTDPRIIYSPGWGRTGVDSECDGTTHDSNDIPGATAAFSFEGTSIQVYGTVPPTEFTSSAAFQVDDLPSITFSFNGDGALHYQMMFYSTTSLSFGNHTLTMTVTSNSSTRLYLDYLLYNPILSTTAPSTSIAAIESAIPSVNVTTIGFQSHCVVDTIVGGVAGATVIGVILGVSLMCLLFHKSRRIQDLFRVQAKPGDDQLIIDRYTTTNASLVTNAAIMTASTTNSNAKLSFDSSPTSPTTTALSWDSIIRTGKEKSGYIE